MSEPPITSHVTSRKRGQEAVPRAAPYSVLALAHYVITLGGCIIKQLVIVATCCDRATRQLIHMKGCTFSYFPVRAQ